MIARTEKSFGFRPRLVIACRDSARAALSSRQFRRLGWEVHLTATGREARRLVAALRPQVVVLDADLGDESGWLTCAKLHLESPGTRIVLVTDGVTPEQQMYGEAAGAAAVVSRDAALPLLIETVHRGALSAAS
jgi:DNA-binding response OmpR family regulator